MDGRGRATEQNEGQSGLDAAAADEDGGVSQGGARAGGGGRRRGGRRSMSEGAGRERSRSHGRRGAPGGSGGVDEVSRGMGGLRVEGRWFCPVVGCVCSEGSGHPGWQSETALKAHIDGHFVGSIQGEVPAAWLRQRGWVPCAVCGLVASANRRGGVHERCSAEARARVQAETGWGPDAMGDDRETGGWGQLLDRLPVVQEIMMAGIATKEFTSLGLRRLYRQEFGRLCGRVVRYNVVGAWECMSSLAGGDERSDTMAMRRCRVAWIELMLFPKAGLRGGKRGVRPGQAYARAKNRLDRWISGERESLWTEAMRDLAGRRGKRRSRTEKERGEAAERLSGLGRAGKAIQALISPGLAEDTQKVERKLMSKFPARTSMSEGDVVLPPAAGAELDDLVKVLKTFDKGAAAGPSGLRPQFLLEMVGEDGDDPVVRAIFEIVMLFVGAGLRSI